MDKKKKNLLLTLVGVSCFSLLLYVNFTINQIPQSPLDQKEGERAVKLQSVENITLYIDYSGVQTNEKFENIYLTNYQTTVYDLLLNCCNVGIQNYGGYIYVNSINGVGTGWTYIVNNGAPPNIPANYYNLIDNDTIKWTYIP